MATAFHGSIERRRFLSLPLATAAAGSGKGPPNIVIFLADDLGWADVGYHGSEIRTPNIDQLASSGVRFERFYSFPVCSPTRSALMTGRSPMRLGVLYSVIRPYSGYGLPLGEHLLPETFRTAGYQTAILGKWHLGHARRAFLPNARGFDHAYGHVNGAIDYFTHVRDGGLDWHRNGKSVREEGYSTELLAREAARLIESRDRARPMLLYMPFNAPHSPLQAPPESLEKYAHIADPRRRTFAAMVDALDGSIGRVLGALDEHGMGENTLVAFLSDNGGPTGFGARNTPLRGQKATTFEGGIRVPAIMRWPGHLPAGRQSHQVMSVTDLFPTLAAASGVTPRNRLRFDGRNLWPAIRRSKTVSREPLFWGVETGAATFLAVRDGDWKLVRESRSGGGEVNDALFRIDRDPFESSDLSRQHPERVRRMIRQLGRWQALHPADGVRFSAAAPEGFVSPPEWIEGARSDSP